MSKLGAIAQATAANIQANTPATNVQSSQTTTTVKTPEQVAQQATSVVKPEIKVEPKPWETVKHKIKYNDAEQELSYQDLISNAQKGIGADAKYQEAAQMRKQAESALRLLKEDPSKAYQLLGITSEQQKQWAVKYLEDQAMEAMLTPQQKTERDERNKLLSAAQELEALKKERSDEQNKAVQAQVEQELGNSIISTLETAGLPKTRETVKRIAQKMLTYREAGFKQVTPADVISDVKREYQEDLKAMLGGAAEDQLEAFLGDDAVKKLIASRNKKILDKNSPFNASPKNSSTKKSSNKKAEPAQPVFKGNAWRRSVVDQWKNK